MDERRSEAGQGTPSSTGRGAALEAVIERARAAALLGDTEDVRRTVAELLEEAGLSASPHDVDAVVSAVGDAPSGG